MAGEHSEKEDAVTASFHSPDKDNNNSND